MPVQDCSEDGHRGYRWGTRGKCYTFGPGTGRTEGEARRLAEAQGAAIDASGGEERSVGPTLVERR